MLWGAFLLGCFVAFMLETIKLMFGIAFGKSNLETTSDLSRAAILFIARMLSWGCNLAAIVLIWSGWIVATSPTLHPRISWGGISILIGGLALLVTSLFAGRKVLHGRPRQAGNVA
jgi:hypothetical protein